MNNELATKNNALTNTGYLGIGQSLKEMFADDMDGMNLSFERIKIPSGGGIAFEVPGDDPNNPDLAKELKAVIVYHHPVFSYYEEKYTGGNEPPQCSSYDGKYGMEAESGEITACETCERFQFGSGENGGKACKAKRRLYILREGDLLPTILSIPTCSLNEFGSYIQRLLKKGRKSSSVVTKFTLKKAQNAGGISYSQVVCSVDRVLTDEEQVAVNNMTLQVKEMAGKVKISEEE